jgi:hypothetical protein
MFEAEKGNVIRPRDKLLAIEDIDLSGMESGKVRELIQSKSMAKKYMLKMTWLNTNLFNQMRCKSVLAS